jgi:hypothetical protein
MSRLSAGMKKVRRYQETSLPILGCVPGFINRTYGRRRTGLVKARRSLSLAALLLLLAPVLNAAEVTLASTDLTRLGGGGPLIANDIVGQPADSKLPVVDPTDRSAAAQLLRSLVSRGVSQGFDGILYDNRDRDHSTLKPAQFPNLSFLEYGPDLVKRGLDYGMAGEILIPATVFGNSSTALTAGIHARSLIRAAMTRRGGPAQAYRDYRINSLYVYPEHRDHDAIDLYPANWPYAITSQGSSGSDIPFLKAIAMTLAAFPADTRARLEEERLIAPTLQMILRRNLKPVRTRSDYLSSIAHPTVFSSEWLQPERMVGHAAALRPEDIPPVVHLKVVNEDFQHQAGLGALDEHLFTTPSAIARLWRNWAWEREMIVSASSTTDPNEHALKFDWVLLRGDPERVRIEPLDADGSRARITVNWHDAFVLPPDGNSDVPSRLTSRVDIGVFAANGRQDSAPAFVSINFPTHQERVYAASESDDPHLLSINYDAARRGVYYDPVLYWSASWADEFRYNREGELDGWTRISKWDRTSFGADGRLSDGSLVTYQIIRSGTEPPVLRPEAQSLEN